MAAAAPEVRRLLAVLSLGGLGLAAALGGLQLHADVLAGETMMGELSAAELPSPLFAELARARLAALPLAALLAALAGLAGTWVLAWARGHAASGVPALVWRGVTLRPAGVPALVRRAARWPQILLVVPLAGLGIAAALLLPAGDPATPAVLPMAWLLGGGLIALAFPLLLAERLLAALPAAALPEAPGLRALAFLATLAFVAAGALELAAGLGAPALALRLAGLLALLPAAVAAELAGRAAGRGFLPPPPAETARAAAESVLARLLAEGAAARSLAAPVRRHLGIDFAGSWALAYVRAAFAPLALLLVLTGWGLSGVALVPLDQRAVYERFGAPVRVLPPGIHLTLPWPFGRLRPVEFGTMHELALKGDSAPERFAAEAVPPPGADRLWELENPAETWFLVAAARAGKQGFQMVSADIRLFWRVGLADADALRATYGAVDPVGLLRQSAGRVAATFFAGRTLDEALGENRETMGGRLRASVQRELDAAGVGLELDAAVIEALHPPGGAADAYHAVQAAQIDAEASISAERGRAFATLSEQRQAATGLLRGAAAGAEETLGAARADATSFTAERDADRAGAPPYRMERRLAALQAALPAAGSLTLLDHLLPAGAVPWLDFRPAPGVGMAAPGADLPPPGATAPPKDPGE
jgi:regulator of protease activity HflC (stomatin/prohibitin superfamily)